MVENISTGESGVRVRKYTILKSERKGKFINIPGRGKEILSIYRAGKIKCRQRRREGGGGGGHKGYKYQGFTNLVSGQNQK